MARPWQEVVRPHQDVLSGKLDESVFAADLEDVRRVARDVVQEDRLKVLVVGDRQAIEPGLRDLGLPIVPVDYEGRQLP